MNRFIFKIYHFIIVIWTKILATNEHSLIDKFFMEYFRIEWFTKNRKQWIWRSPDCLRWVYCVDQFRQSCSWGRIHPGIDFNKSTTFLQKPRPWFSFCWLRNLLWKYPFRDLLKQSRYTQAGFCSQEHAWMQS